MTDKARPRIRQGAVKRATNVSIRADLLQAARNAGLNLSATLERALAAELAGEKRRQWLAQNDAAIAAYNESVSRLGVFSNGRRRF